MAKRVNEPARVSHGIVALNAKWKLAISVLLALHLLAIVAEPLALFTRGPNGTSPAVSPIRNSLAPYIEFAYLDHGYFFFAPNPAPSHLLECSLKSQDGEQSRLRLPDRNAQWPRLLYHRHFMLAEFLHNLHFDPVTEQDVAVIPNKDLLQAWRRDRARFEMVRDSMIKHLKFRYEVDSAEIFRMEHRLPSADEVFRDRLPLNDERLYVQLPDASIEPTPAAIPEPIPGATNSTPILDSNANSAEQVQP